MTDEEKFAMTTEEKRARFRALHRSGDPLLLPNAWDHASAVALHRAGFAAVGTTSLGVAAAAGLPDGAAATREATLAIARLLGPLPVPVTVDAEGGFSDDPAQVGALAAELAAAGVAGINLEDGLGDGALLPVAAHAERVTAAKAAAPGLFVNARTDTHWPPVAGDGGSRLDEALARVRAYADAGADGVFVPGLAADADVAAVTAAAGVPVNVLFLPGLEPRRLAELGVARVSTGSLLFRAALRGALETARAVTAGDLRPAGIPAYAEVNGWATHVTRGGHPPRVTAARGAAAHDGLLPA
jgi:2-methylisocitrate lyase-like PEP mutase family enzyme